MTVPDPDPAATGTPDVAGDPELGAGAASAPESAGDAATASEPVADAVPEPAPAQGDDPAPVQGHEPEVVQTQVEVTLQRTVRYGPVIIGCTVACGLLFAVACLFFPIDEGADYTMAQVAGFAAMIGAAVGLLIGGLLSLSLGLIARRKRGRAIAVQTDVR